MDAKVREIKQAINRLAIVKTLEKVFNDNLVEEEFRDLMKSLDINQVHLRVSIVVVRKIYQRAVDSSHGTFDSMSAEQFLDFMSNDTAEVNAANFEEVAGFVAKVSALVNCGIIKVESMSETTIEDILKGV